MTALDAIGPHEVLSRLPGASVQRVALHAGQSVAESLQLGLEYDPEQPFEAGSPTKANPLVVEVFRARLLAQFE